MYVACYVMLCYVMLWYLLFGPHHDKLLAHEGSSTADLRTKIIDFRGFDSSIILSLMGGIPRTFESINLSRDNISREIGHTVAGKASMASPPNNLCGCASAGLRSRVRFTLSNGVHPLPSYQKKAAKGLV